MSGENLQQDPIAQRSTKKHGPTLGLTVVGGAHSPTRTASDTVREMDTARLQAVWFLPFV